MGMDDQDDQVRLYYSRKTLDILHKYGPGPRVHFHLGLFADGSHPPTAVPQAVLRQRITDAQEAIVEHAARSWGAYEKPPRRLLDIGCGLGGGSLYWAQQHGAQVTGLTIAPEHVPIVREFARQAGVSRQVTPILGDVHDLREHHAYDAAYANESSGYTDRTRLFEVVAEALEPGGWFGIQEHFLRELQWRGFIDRYYRTRLGTRTEYLIAAEAAGFELARDEDVTDVVAEFWTQSTAWNTAELERLRAGGATAGGWSPERLRESTRTQRRLLGLWRDHAVETRLLLFRLGGGR
ncbi:methyltransferase domain-containing protein [Streptomyces sp. RerS4]|uniref:SAM-dependent methyltransferase n=1 Tax=Streptomyces sp. RerS4 TaxID=2942449 RepID=UPI00201C5AFE|nr:methyltransferase domain-containing protein [Streptomyces sp. RerS4]UQW99522.1 methyltransferase domain-containing protein [Streptomyces sp. RerS4]